MGSVGTGSCLHPTREDGRPCATGCLDESALRPGDPDGSGNARRNVVQSVEASRIELGFPHDFLRPEGNAKRFVYGDTLEQLDGARVNPSPVWRH